MKEQVAPKHKDMYVFNLDLTRVFWILAITLFCITFFFLFGYWLGSDTNYLDIQKDNMAKKPKSSNVVTYNQSDAKDFENIKKNEVQSQLNTQNDQSQNTSNGDTPPKDPDQSPQNNNQANNTNKSENNPESETNTPKENIRENNQDNPIQQVGHKKENRKNHRGKFTIQVSINKVKKNAYHLKDKLNRKGFQAYILVRKKSPNNKIYLVRVGSFSSEQEASRVHKKLRQIKEAHNSIIINN